MHAAPWRASRRSAADGARRRERRRIEWEHAMHAIMKTRRRAGEVVVVTGASAGVGRATARAFARRSARIGLIARDSEALQATCRDVDALGGKGLVCVADVAHATEVESAASMIEDRLGPIDIWVN